MSPFRYAVFGVALATAPALAQEKSAIRPGFAFPTDHPVRILVFRPEVKVGSQSAGGTVSPNAEWARNARRNIAGALTAAKPAGGADVVFMPDPQGDAASTLLADYRALFGAVADTVLQHRLFKGDRLPTKKTGFEYSLGPDVSRLAAGTGGDYALFLFTNDAYGTAGRKMLQVAGLLMAGATGVATGISSGQHTGYAGLVELRTGNLVWMNADAQMGGDVREADGATKRVAQLLQGLPSPPRAQP